MKKIFLLAIFFMTILSSYGQTISDTIEIKQKALGTAFRLNDKNLTPKQLLKITESNQAAYAEMETAKKNSDMASVFGIAGGLLIGWPIGAAFGGSEEPRWYLAGIGAGLIVVSIPFSTAYTKHAKNAVRIYNEGLKKTGMNTVGFEMGLTCSGVKLKLTF